MNRTQGALTAFLFLLSPQAAAQNSSDTLLSAHSRAVQFQIRNNFTLGSFQGAALSYKHHLQSSFALRFGISVSLNDGNSESASRDFYHDTLLGSSTSTGDQNNTSIQFNAQAVWYSESSLGIFLFYGTGPFVSFSRNHQEQERVSSPVSFPQSKSTAEATSTSWSAGISGLAGVEWFASRSVSLHAEYGFSLGRSWTSSESTSTSLSPTQSSTTSQGDGKSWILSSNGVLFGLSVYFR